MSDKSRSESSGNDIRLFAKHDPALLPFFRSATVGIAGAGGLGSNVATCLVRAGIGRLIIADEDRVEPSNLNRQQFFSDQIGLPKVEALRDNLTRISVLTECECHFVRLTPENLVPLFQEASILVEALDTLEGKIAITSVWTATFPERPLILGNGLGGVGGNNAMRTECLFEQVYTCGDGTSDVAQFPPLAPKVMLVAAMQANLVLELLTCNGMAHL